MLWLLLPTCAAVLAQAPEPAQEAPPVEASPATPEPAVQSAPPDVGPDALGDGLLLAGGAELGPAIAAGALALQLRPTVAVEVTEDFALRIGAPLRFTNPTTLRLRDEDWDSLSDFGQILEALSVGSASRRVQLRVGELRWATLGAGHLVSGYSNRSSEDYHPAGAQLRAWSGPFAIEAMASDVLALRMLAAAARLSTPDERFRAEISALHDAARGEGVAPSLTLLHADLNVAILQGPRWWLNAFAGAGARVAVLAPSVGGVVGLSVDVRAGRVSLGGRLEGRRVSGSYRPAMVGGDYELARFSGIGLAELPLADERLADGFSAMAEAQLAYAGASTKVSGVASVEVFSQGRTDARARASMELWSRQLVAMGELAVVGLSVAPRVHANAEVRFRWRPSLYASAILGTAYRPLPSGVLQSALSAGVGLGADFEVSRAPW